MPPKKKAAAKKEAVQGTRRSSRNTSAPAETLAGTKRKASPSPVASKRAASTKKGRTRSPSPAPDNSRKSTRGKQVEETKPEVKASSRNTSQKGRVTRNVVQEVDIKKSNASKKAVETKKAPETKKPAETKSRSSSRAAKSPVKPITPKSKPSTPKPKVETPKAATPRGRSSTPRQQKETPKKDVTPKKESPKQKATPKRNASPKSAVAKKSPPSKSPKKESPVRSSRSRRSKEPAPEEEEEKEEEEQVDAADESEEVIPEENVSEDNAGKEGTKADNEAAVDEEEPTEPEETKDAEEEVKAEEQEENVKSVDESEKVDSEVNEEINEDKEEDEEESMETEDNDVNKDEEKVKEDAEEAGEIEEEMKQIEEEVKEVEELQNNEKLTESVICDENQKENAANNGETNDRMGNSIENESAVKDVTPSDSVEVIGDTVLKPTADVTEFKEDTEEIPVVETEPAIINNASNVEEEAGASGDQVIKNNDDVEEALVADLPNDKIQEITNTCTEANGGQNVVESVVDNQDAMGANDNEDMEDKSKRKFEDVEQDENASSLKRPRVEEEIQQNGATSCEDVAKDYVVIEMGDVPQAESSEVQGSLPNPIFNRPFIPNPAFSGSSDVTKHFSIASYNMLADCHLFRNDYSFTEAKYLASDYRLNKVIEEIRYLDADVLCMQEVDPDYYTNLLLPSLTSLGYGGLFEKRMLDYYKEGEATFYKTSRFTLVKSTLSSFSELVEKELSGIDPSIQDAVRAYMNLPDVIVIAKLRCNTTGQEVTVGNVHIQWGEMKVPDAQCVQIASAVKEIVSNADGDVFPHIICGDFNSPPMSPGYLVARDGYPSGDETINKLMQINNLELPEGKKSSLVNSLWPAFQHTSSSLRSAYSEAQGYESEVSSFNRVMCDCVDYIFYSSMSLDNVGVLQMAPKEKIMETGGTPNCNFPSDHVSIKAVLSFK